MNQPHYERRPLWVINQSLNGRFFNCCGAEDFFPFKCSVCHRPMVLCDECDSLYADLQDLSPGSFDMSCPACRSSFDEQFRRSPRYRLDFDEWHNAGLDNLLIDRPFCELLDTLSAFATHLSGFLRRGMRSTAKCYMTDYRNLAESIAIHIPEANSFRDQGCAVAESRTLAASMEWLDQIPNLTDKAYALLGITDVVLR